MQSLYKAGPFLLQIIMKLRVKEKGNPHLKLQKGCDLLLVSLLSSLVSARYLQQGSTLEQVSLVMLNSWGKSSQDLELKYRQL